MTDATSETETNHAAAEDAEEKIAETYRSELKEKRPDAEKITVLLEEHRHHLVRETTSKLSEKDEVAEGMVTQKTAEIPDTYCFTCDEWVGISGVDLRGTPRSRKDAYYLDGPPQEVKDASQSVRETTAELAGEVAQTVPHVDDVAEALKFIETELEQAQERVEGAST